MRRAWMTGYRHEVTWDLESLTIGLGQRYAGAIDELLILDRELADDEIGALYRLDRPLLEAL